MITENSSSSEVDQPELRVLQRAELEKWHQPYGGALKVMHKSQTLEQEGVTLKVTWKPQDDWDPELSAICWGKLLTGSRTSPWEKSLLQSTKMKKELDTWRPLCHQAWRCSVWTLSSSFSVLLWGLQLSDWMNLRRDIELWTFNIVETAIDYG